MDDPNAGEAPTGGIPPTSPPVEAGAEAGGRMTVLSKVPSNGSSVALTPDESRVVVCNRDKGSVTVFSVVYGAAAPAMTKVAEVDLGAGTEPWQVAIDPAGDRAYVTLRQGQKLVRIDGLNGTPQKGPEIVTGSEPTGVALSPRGAHAYVANWVDGTITDVATETMTVAKTINLNSAISSLLGTNLSARPGMAHPRSLAVSNNGNDVENDEFLYVTEYFAIRTAAESANGDNSDISKGGIVYRVKLTNDNVETIPLAPLPDMGFAPTPGAQAGCFPNQLQSITLNGKYAYVLSVCASPRGPLGVRTTMLDCPSGPGPDGNAECNAAGTQEGACQANLKCNDLATIKTTTAPLLSVIDTSVDPPTEIKTAAANLNKRFFDRYAAAAAPVADDASRRLPLLANDLSFVPGAPVGYISANGTNAAFRVTFAPTGEIATVGSDAPLAHFVDLTNKQPQDLTNPVHGLLPTGLVAGSKNLLFVSNDVSRNVSVVDLAAQTLAGGATPIVVESTARATAGADLAVLKGRLFFNTGLGRWSLRGQGWGACQSCHTDGLTDNVTWYFGRGPRQSVSLDGSFSSTASGSVQRIFNWTAVFDDVADFEGNTRGTSGGVGAIVKDTTAPISNGQRIDLTNTTTFAGARHDNLNGSAKLAADAVTDQFSVGAGEKSVLNDWAEIEEYMKTIRAPRGALSVDPMMVAAGRALFTNNNCQGCHGGPLWTVSELFYMRNAANAFNVTEALSLAPWDVATFPTSISPTGATSGTMRSDPNTGNDSLLCALRQVQTFNIAAPGVGIAELRQDMATTAQGASGFSPPSLLGVSVGAPYLHAGNARTLEELFTDTFASHHRALGANFLTGADAEARRLEIIHFLLSLDDSTLKIDPPVAGPTGGKLCAP